jgi:hypothetical protein
MSQQEFEPQSASENEIYEPRYPYGWSPLEREGMPRDEPPSSYGVYQEYQAGQAQVPWWARPQPNQMGPFVFAGVVVLVILITLLAGVLGIAGIVIGSLAHIVGVIIGASLALLLFAVLMVFLVLSLVWRALGKTSGLSRPGRRSWRDLW